MVYQTACASLAHIEEFKAQTLLLWPVLKHTAYTPTCRYERNDIVDALGTMEDATQRFIDATKEVKRSLERKAFAAFIHQHATWGTFVCEDTTWGLVLVYSGEPSAEDVGRLRAAAPALFRDFLGVTRPSRGHVAIAFDADLTDAENFLDDTVQAAAA